MPDRIKRSFHGDSSWQKYQASLQRTTAHKKLKKFFLKSSSILILLAFLLYGIAIGFSSTACHQIFSSFIQTSDKSEITSAIEEPSLFTKKDLQGFLGEANFLELDRQSFSIDVDGKSLIVETSINIPLQQYLFKRLDKKTSRKIGIVVMDPSTGKVHALVGFDKTDKSKNPCIDGRFPAASIFKIVTAVAGIEQCGFSSGSNFTFNGGKHTLYKSQLRERKNRYTNSISFQDSFAQSVNPVFGKIGANYLGKDNLVDYALSFGFNRIIDLEVPFPSSYVHITDKSYQWAEIACGFNRETIMTPMHGALLSAAIVNQGGLLEPSIVSQITDENGKIIYRSEPKIISYVSTPGTADVVSNMMRATVRTGTSRKAFRGARKDKILSKLNIGGKTGSIGSRKISHVKYDWFVGFAEEKEGSEKLVVSVMVAHEKYIGKRAGYYARTAIKQYFRHYYDQKKVKIHTNNKVGNRKDKPA